MTREEIIQGLEFTISMFLFDPSTGETFTEPRNDMDKTTIDACKGAIEMLKREPCGDAISRQAAIHIASGYCHPANIADELAKLPHVQPEPKTGHWIEGRTNNPKIHNILCSNCGDGVPSKGHARSYYTQKKFKYCPNCGARMIDPQESEEEE